MKSALAFKRQFNTVAADRIYLVFFESLKLLCLLAHSIKVLNGVIYFILREESLLDLQIPKTGRNIRQNFHCVSIEAHIRISGFPGVEILWRYRFTDPKTGSSKRI